MPVRRVPRGPTSACEIVIGTDRLAQPPAAAHRRRTPVLAALLLMLGIGGFAAVWILLGTFTGRQHSWMAVLAALDIALMLHLGGWAPGPLRAAVAMASTLLIALIASWGITASHLGRALGLLPWESALKLGFNHAWTLAQLTHGVFDLLWLALALLVAALASR